MNATSRLLAATALVALSVTLARADEKAVQLSFFAPDLQLQPSEADIRGIRLSVYGESHDVTGFDLGFAGVTTGDFNGYSLQFVYGRIDGDAYGVAESLILHVRGDGCGVGGGCVAFFEKDFTGLCGGVYSDVSGLVTGAQLGFVNSCNELCGVQFGLVNMAHTGTGLQLGLVNIFDEGFLPVCPFINFHF